ncbi:hypothetical protein LC653_31250 [Nostoc sp. CHAB 5784]|uniref:hypothetical protein n=1 Tax=Nostoc mirabile TaxID=2907820 RepID=UPI001E62D4B7|nr:hypothetical protein [Nostoc mirabile]MCC5668219.1 hypothetical protein [Nostoc mirabile CHAB5784]
MTSLIFTPTGFEAFLTAKKSSLKRKAARKAVKKGRKMALIIAGREFQKIVAVTLEI